MRFFVVSKVRFGVSKVHSGMPETFFLCQKCFSGHHEQFSRQEKRFFREIVFFVASNCFSGTKKCLMVPKVFWGCLQCSFEASFFCRGVKVC